MHFRDLTFVLPLLLLVPTDLHADSRSECATAVEHLGFEVSDYVFEKGGLFSYDKHRFGTVACEVDLEGDIRRITRGERLLADEGFYGPGVLNEKLRTEEQARQQREKAREERNRKIDAARATYTADIERIDRDEQTALDELASENSPFVDNGVRQPSEAPIEDALPDAPKTEPRSQNTDPISIEVMPPKAVPPDVLVDDQTTLEPKREPLVDSSTLAHFRDLVEGGKWSLARDQIRDIKSIGGMSEEGMRVLERRLVQLVRPVPASDFGRNLDGYRLLAELDSKNEAYSEKVQHYLEASLRARISEQSAKLRVTVDKLPRRLCANARCGSPGNLLHGEIVSVREVSDGWVRINDYFDAGCFGGTTDYVDFGNNRCVTSNGIVDGRTTEWVELRGLELLN